jgi:hypothetical protein
MDTLCLGDKDAPAVRSLAETTLREILLQYTQPTQQPRRSHAQEAVSRVRERRQSPPEDLVGSFPYRRDLLAGRLRYLDVAAPRSRSPFIFDCDAVGRSSEFTCLLSKP